MLESFSTIGGQYIAADPVGNVYVVSNASPPTVYKITPAGVAVALPVSGAPIAADPSGNVFLAQFQQSLVAQKLAPDGTITSIRIAGTSDRTNMVFFQVGGLAVDQRGNLYISDGNLHQIRKLSPEGDLTTLAGLPLPGGAEVDGVPGGFRDPRGMAVDAAGNVYVADADGHTVRKVTPTGVVTTLAGVAYVAGSMDGAATAATFNFPASVAVDASGNVYVADVGNALIRKISPAGQVTTVAGTRGLRGFTPGPLPGVIDPPSGLALVGRSLFFTTSAGDRVIRNLP